MRALARYMQKQLIEKSKETAPLDGLISGIRRYPVEEMTASRGEIIRLLRKLSMRDKIADVAFPNDPIVRTAIGHIASEIAYSRGETFRIAAGLESIRVILDEKNLERLRSVPAKPLKTNTDLAEIIVSLDEKVEHTPGVFALVSTELAVNGINLIEFMSCVPELVIVVEEKDALKGYELLQNLAKAAYP